MDKLNILLKDFIAYLKYNEKSERTIIHYRHVINLFIKFTNDKQDKDKDITKYNVIEFKANITDKYMPSTVTNYITIINKFLKYLEYEDITVKNIKLQQKSSLNEVLEPNEYKRLVRKAKQLNQIDLYLIMKIIAYTGIRIGELKYFTVANIKSNYIRVTNKGKTRNIIVRQDLKRELVNYCKSNNIKDGYIFTGSDGVRNLCDSTIWKRLKKLTGQCRGINKSKVHAHSFRHLFAIKFLDDGGDITELADILGHSSINTTRIYTRTTDKMKKDKLERMRY